MTMKLVIILCSLDCRQRAKRKMSWPWKNFSAWLFFSSLVRCKSNSRRKEIRSDFWSNLTQQQKEEDWFLNLFLLFIFWRDGWLTHFKNVWLGVLEEIVKNYWTTKAKLQQKMFMAQECNLWVQANDR